MLYIWAQNVKFQLTSKVTESGLSEKTSIEYTLTKTHRHKQNCIYFTAVIGIKMQYHQAAKQCLKEN